MIGKAKILIVEDESEIRRYLRAILSAADLIVLEAKNAREAISQLATNAPDLVLLDLGLPDGDGQDFIKRVREWSQIPIIILSARTEDNEKVEALESGADDYLTKPFSTPELLARIRVALRRNSSRAAQDNHLFEYRELKLDFAARSVTQNGENIKLTPIEYKLLQYLVLNAGKVLTQTQIIKEVWARHTAEDTSYLRIHMQHLREKLGDDAMNPKYILTLPGVGYKFIFD